MVTLFRFSRINSQGSMVLCDTPQGTFYSIEDCFILGILTDVCASFLSQHIDLVIVVLPACIHDARQNYHDSEIIFHPDASISC